MKVNHTFSGKGLEIGYFPTHTGLGMGHVGMLFFAAPAEHVVVVHSGGVHLWRVDFQVWGGNSERDLLAS